MAQCDLITSALVRKYSSHDAWKNQRKDVKSSLTRPQIPLPVSPNFLFVEFAVLNNNKPTHKIMWFMYLLPALRKADTEAGRSL